MGTPHLSSLLVTQHMKTIVQNVLLGKRAKHELFFSLLYWSRQNNCFVHNPSCVEDLA